MLPPAEKKVLGCRANPFEKAIATVHGVCVCVCACVSPCVLGRFLWLLLFLFVCLLFICLLSLHVFDNVLFVCLFVFWG